MLVGQTVTMLTGAEATIIDFGAVGATVQVRKTAQIRLIPMHEILWGVHTPSAWLFQHSPLPEHQNLAADEVFTPHRCCWRSRLP